MVPRAQAQGAIQNSIVVESEEYMRWVQQQAIEFQSMSNQLVSEMFIWEENRQLTRRSSFIPCRES